MKILVAGFQHETNTFAPTKADWAAFNRGDSFPAFIRGEAMLVKLSNINIPIAGFLKFAEQQGWQIKPSAWAGAIPSAHVTEDAFERMSTAILYDAKTIDFDAIYLDLHGAAVAEHIDDCEGELIERLRGLVGTHMPIVVSLDSHANVTERMLNLADALTCYRTYPHVDMAATGERAGQLLLQRITSAIPLNKSVQRIPFLLALNSQSTMTEPGNSIMRHLAQIDHSLNTSSNFATGFPAADIFECGPVVWAYGEQAEQAAAKLAKDIIDRRLEWVVKISEPDAVVQEAMALASQTNQGPVIIADTQDNPGAGGDSNTTGLLHALLRQGAGKAFPGQVALGLLFDPVSATAAHQAGVGSQIELAIGKSVDTGWDEMSEEPVQRVWTVEAVSDGVVTLLGPMMTGMTVHLGACARLQCEGVHVIVSSGKKQMLDRELFRFLGLTPETMKILVNKSSVHFRADFTGIASHILVGKASGPMAADPFDLPWQKINPAMALSPHDA
jgi:microcystin degradation protein MlrC